MADREEFEALAGRLIMVGVRGAQRGDDALEADLDSCSRAGVRAIILFDRDASTGGVRNIVEPAQTRALTDYIRNRLGRETIIAVDQEGGAVARMKESAGFAPTIAAAQIAELDDEERLAAAHRMAKDVASAGIDWNFAPCVDLAIEARNPIIALMRRAFASDPEIVIRCAREVIEAHAEAGVATCLKHFPGHGSSRGDTHEGLVDVTDSFEGSRELRPYAVLLPETWARSLPVGVMTAHVIDRSIDQERPASLSAGHHDRLRREIGFEGVVITDSLDMGAVSGEISIEEAASLALRAGADMVLDCNNAPRAARPSSAESIAARIVEDVHRGAIPGGVERLQASARRIDGLMRRRAGG